MTDQRDISIRVQSAAHDAAGIYAGLHQPGEAFDLDAFAAIHAQIYTHLAAFTASEQEQLAVASVVQAFPGAQMVPPVPDSSTGPFDTPHDQQLMPPVPGQPPVYAPPAPPVGYQPPVVPQQQYAPPPTAGYPAPPAVQYPPPPVQQQPPMQGAGCPKCGGQTYDNRQDNQRKRAGGFKLSADFKCKNKQCSGVIWPADFQAYANAPYEPRR